MVLCCTIVVAHSNLVHCRDAGEGLFVVKFVTKMDVDVFKGRKGLLYKYVVFSQQTKEPGHHFECLYGAPKGDIHLTSRLLSVLVEKRRPGGN